LRGCRHPTTSPPSPPANVPDAADDGESPPTVADVKNLILKAAADEEKILSYLGVKSLDDAGREGLVKVRDILRARLS
jgi:hypothetical protein